MAIVYCCQKKKNGYAYLRLTHVCTHLSLYCCIRCKNDIPQHYTASGYYRDVSLRGATAIGDVTFKFRGNGKPRQIEKPQRELIPSSAENSTLRKMYGGIRRLAWEKGKRESAGEGTESKKRSRGRNSSRARMNVARRQIGRSGELASKLSWKLARVSRAW